MRPSCYSTWAAFTPKVELQQDLGASYLFGGLSSERSGRQEKKIGKRKEPPQGCIIELVTMT